MNIIIAGAGMVGFRLATTLSVKHNITVIDKNAEALNLLAETIDILPIPGNAEDPSTYQLLLKKEADLFIAVTDSDEVNIISSLIAAETLKIAQKIVRLRNPFFSQSRIIENIGITEAVYPIVRTAKAVRTLVDFPQARSVKRLNQTPLRLISLRLRLGQEPISVRELISNHVQVVGLERDRTYTVPNLSYELQADDLIYLYGDPEHIKALCKRMDSSMPKKIKNILLFGADALGIEIAKNLIAPGVSIKLIEKNSEKRHNAANLLGEKVTIINSQYGESRLIHEEGLENADMMVATSKYDQDNIVKCLEAREYGVKKVVGINNDNDHYSLMHQLDISVVRGQKNNAYYSIIEKINSSLIANSRYFCGGKAVAITRNLLGDSALIGKSIQPLLGEGIIAIYLREEKIYRFTQPLVLQENDSIMVFAAISDEERLKEWIYNL